MKRLFRGLIGPAWWALGPLRRAVMAGFDARVVRLVSGTVESRVMPPILEALQDAEVRLERIERLMIKADRTASTAAGEVDVVLNGLSREVFRLRAQVERLRERSGAVDGGLSIVAEPEEDGPAGRSLAG